MRLKIIVGMAAVATLTGCLEEEWMGFVYPNRADLTEHIEIGVYSSLEQCRAAAQDKLVLSGRVNTGDYECGLSCERKAEFGGLYVCKETAR